MDHHELSLAVQDRNLERVRQLLESVNLEPPSESLKLLCEAVESGDKDIIELLLKSGASVNVPNDEENVLETPLTRSIKRRDPEIIQMLLNAGVDIDACNSEGKTPLHHAIHEGIEVVKVLLDNNADVNAKDKDGKSPLCYAEALGSQEIVRLLIDRGHDSKSEGDLTPLHVAIKRKYKQTVRHYVKLGVYTNVNVKGEGTPLHMAVKNRSDFAEMLLEHGADVDAQDNEGNTALYWAARNGDAVAVELILRYRPDINNVGNRKALRVVVVEGWEAERFRTIVGNLLQYGFKVDSGDVDDSRFLEKAVEMGYLRIVEGFLECVAEDKVDSFRNRTACGALLIAAREGQKEILKMLAEFGVNVNATDSDKRTALFHVIEWTLFCFSEKLESGDDVHRDELFGIERECIEMVEILLQNGVLPNSRDCANETVLHYIASYEVRSRYNILHETAKLFLRNGATVHDYSTDPSPLTLTFDYPNRGLMTLFLEYGALTFCRKNDRKHLLFCSTRGYHECFEIPLKLGADIDSTDKNGFTALQFACRLNNELLVLNLLQYGSDVNRVRGGQFCTSPMSVSKGEVADIILRHTVKLWSAGFPGYMGDSKRREHHMRITDFTEQCVEELKVMKNEKIGRSNVTFRDILTEDTDKLQEYAKYEDIVVFLNSDDCKQKFPIYASVLKGFIRRGIVRRALLEQSVEVFHDYCDSLPVLPRICIEQILRHLTDKELRNFVRRYLNITRLHLLGILTDREEDLTNPDIN